MARQKESNNGSRRDNRNTFTDEFLGSIDKDGILSNAQDIISSAVNVLEEEIAAGILAAKKIEKEFIDVDNIRHDTDDLMNRIRRDTHEAVDLFMDALAAITRHVSELSESLDNRNGAAKKSGNEVKFRQSRDTIPVIRPENPLKPGESAELVMAVCNDKPEETASVHIQKTRLTAPGRQTIHTGAIKIEPSELTLDPGEEKEVSIQIKVPKKSLPGIYHAMLTDSNGCDFRAALELEVKK